MYDIVSYHSLVCPGPFKYSYFVVGNFFFVVLCLRDVTY